MGLRSTRRAQVIVLAAVSLLVIMFLLRSSGPAALAIIKGKGSFQGAIEKERLPPEPPTWVMLRKWEENLPQHNLTLPYPEGKKGKYVKFSNQIQQLGWNNVLNDL
ncbi:hypothetical protein V5O48_012284, partial [Marasmius crinis-equi]